MSKTLQEQVYDYIAQVLNYNSKGLIISTGYHVAIQKGIPYVIDDTGSAFDYKKQEVIPLTEEYSNETPSVNKSDRGDFGSSYQLFFRIKGTKLDDVRTTLEEYRTYMLANKDVVIDGYNISFKTTRGEKLPDLAIEDGSMYAKYIIKVYYSAVKNGYLSKNTDIWEMGAYDGDTAPSELEELITTQDIASTSANSQPSIKSSKVTHYNTSASFTDRLNVIYDDTDLCNLLYDHCMNKADINQKYTLKETFNETERSYEVIITSASRTRLPGGLILMEIGVLEVA